MASGLKRDPIVILRIDGEDLLAFINSPSFEPAIASALTKIPPSSHASLKDCAISVFEKLTVDQGMPPATDPWVLSNIVEPAVEYLGNIPASLLSSGDDASLLLVELKRAAENVAKHLKEQPAIVAHSHTTFDGSEIKRLFSSSKFELDKTLYSASTGVPRDENGRISTENLAKAFDFLTASTGCLPPFGLDTQMDKLIKDSLERFSGGDNNAAKLITEDEFKEVLTLVLGSIMEQLEANPVSVSVNSVVHEPSDAASSQP